MKLVQFNACLNDLSMCYQEKNIPDASDPMWRMYATTGDILDGNTAYCMSTMLRRASPHELVLRIMVYKTTIGYDGQAPRAPIYNGESTDITFTFECDARSIGRLWKTLPLWHWAVPYSLVLRLAGLLPAYADGNMAAVRQAWADYFSGFSRPFACLRLTTVSAEAL